MGKTGRLWAWFSAIAVAILGVTMLEASELVSLNSTIPPYRTAQFAWLRYVLGGLMFGIGMTLAGGCGNKILVNIGGGNLKSVMVLIVAGVMAYLMTKTSFYEVFFYPWINATTIDLSRYDMSSQGVPELVRAALGMQSAAVLQIGLGFAVAAILLILAFRERSFRNSGNNIAAGLAVGLIIVGGWYLTGGPLGRAVIESVEWLDAKPLGVGVQSFTFINPMGETLYYLREPANTLRLTFGVIAVAGVVIGSLLFAVLSRKFSPVWFKSRSDFANHFVGGLFMGVGGVLAMGCTIGQGISGVSTLALGSLLVLISIIFASALTMKIQYYQMVYEDEAGFIGALLSSLADMHVVPNMLRRLDTP